MEETAAACTTNDFRDHNYAAPFSEVTSIL
jgi:hypothetical protein